MWSCGDVDVQTGREEEVQDENALVLGREKCNLCDGNGEMSHLQRASRGKKRRGTFGKMMNRLEVVTPFRALVPALQSLESFVFCSFYPKDWVFLFQENLNRRLEISLLFVSSKWSTTTSTTERYL